jgi:predicted RNA-binding Zn-ribbon protein involved in translation (DUF1610 family)
VNNNKSNDPLTTQKGAGKVCPVCGLTSYSRGGIHPQCALTQADAPRVKRLKVAKKLGKQKEKAPRTRALSHWQKRCPKCGHPAHVRALTCGCGHQFARSS